MTDSYEGNGDYSYNDEESDFKRKMASSNDNNDDHQNEQPSLNEKANDYIRDCLMEKNKLDKCFPIAERLLESEIESVQRTGRIPTRDPKYVDIYREKPIRVSQKVLVPVKEHPKFNFVGKLLGPKGNSLRRLQEETLCKMTVLGRNSMKDRQKEEELRNSMDPKYAHLIDDLHVEISTIAPPAEAHARIAYAMAELRKYLIPDSNDVIRQEQLRELMDSSVEVEYEKPQAPYKPRGMPGVGGAGSAGPRSSYAYRPPPPVSAHPPPASARSVMPPKQKVLSILDRARSAMDETYSRHYEEPIAYEPPTYDSYSYGHAPPVSSRVPYEVPEYEASEYRREYYPHSPSYPEKPKMIMKSSSSSSARPSWKASNSAAPSYHHSSSSRRHDEMHPSSFTSSSKHTHSSREARYKSAPYQRAK